MNIKACLSSKNDQWTTPQDFFDKLNDEFHFDLDPCADEYNHKCEEYFTREQGWSYAGLGRAYGFLQSAVWP